MLILIVKSLIAYVEITHIKNELKKQRKNAPMMPSVVFLGERLWAKGLDPNIFPKKSPPLSAYQVKENATTRNFAL